MLFFTKLTEPSYFFTVSCIIFSSFFFFQKKLPIVVVRDVCPSVGLSVRLSSLEINYFCGNSLSNTSHNRPQ